MLAYRKTGDVSVDELNGETSVDRGVGGGHGGYEGAGVVGSGAGVGRSQACVGAGGLDIEEGFLTLGDVDRDGESVENERKEDKGACLPTGCHDGEGDTGLEAEVRSSVHLTRPTAKNAHPESWPPPPSHPLRIPGPPEISPLQFAGNIEALEDTQPHEHRRNAKRSSMMV